MTDMKIVNKYYKNADKYYKKDFVIYGNAKFADVIFYYLKNDTPFFNNFKNFIIPKEFIKKKKIENFLVLDENKFIKNFDPKRTIIIMGIGHINLNKVRNDAFDKYKNAGFTFFNYLSSNANIDINTNNLEGVTIFGSCNIQPYTKIESNVIIRNNTNISHHCEIKKGAFLSNNVCTGGNVKIGKNTFIGLSTVISDNITVKSNNFIAANSHLTVSTKNNSVYRGSPAKYICNIKKFKF